MAHPRDIKPDPYRPPTREEIARARTMYAEGFTVSRILAATDMSLGTLYYWLDGGPNEAEGPSLPPVPRRKTVVGKRRRALRTSPVSLTARLWRTAERQVRDIEQRLALPARTGPERERDVRIFGTLVKALRDLSVFARAAGQQGHLPDDEDAPPDVEAMRADLARRLDAMISSQEFKAPGAESGTI